VSQDFKEKDQRIISLSAKHPQATGRDEAPTGAEQKLVPAPDPEVGTEGKRRIMTAAYKARILRKADACTKPGEVGALLRREGLYSSHLSTWRQKRDASLVPQKRGRKADPETKTKQENVKLRREIERLTTKLRHAELIIDVQKKVASLLGNTLPPMQPEDETR
jgi:hypothetical protein